MQKLPSGLKTDEAWDVWEEHLLEQPQEGLVQFLLSRMMTDPEFMRLVYTQFGDGICEDGQEVVEAFCREVDYELQQEHPDMEYLVSLSERFFQSADALTGSKAKQLVYEGIAEKLKETWRQLAESEGADLVLLAETENDAARYAQDPAAYGRAFPEEKTGSGKAEVTESVQKTVFMNMCRIGDGKGHVLVLDKVDGSYRGITFPGGHVEERESFEESVVREVKEETGLLIHAPHLCGIFQWHQSKIKYVVLLYRTESYTGTLRGSEEGNVYWMKEEEFLTADLAEGMEEVWQIMTGEMREYCE